MDIEIIILILGVIYYIWYSIKKAAEEVKKNRPGQGGVPPGREEKEEKPLEDTGRPANRPLPEPAPASPLPAETLPETSRSKSEPADEKTFREREASRTLRRETGSTREKIKSLRPVKPEHPQVTVRYPQDALREPFAYQEDTAANHPYADFDLRDAVIKSVILERVTG